VVMKALTKLEENVLLAILRLNDNAYIVSIKDHLEQNTGNTISFGALYVLLKRLTKYNFLENYVGESVSIRGGRAKKYYRITKNGIAALQEVRKVQDVMWNDFDRLARGHTEG